MIGDDIDFEIAFAVEESWHQIKKVPNYEEVAGEILFRKIFELAPVALNMYSFGPEFVGNEESLYQSEKFKNHARGVVSMLDKAVNMLGPDLEPALIVLSTLGGKHVEYGVLPAHYGIVGEALIHTLKTVLGDKWTPRVRKGWTLIYGLVSTAMMTGADQRLEKKRRQQERLEGRKNAADAVKSYKKGAESSSRRRRKDRGKTSLRLAEVTGIQALARTTPDNSRQEKVSQMLNDALSVASVSSESMESTATCEPSEPHLDETSFAHTIEVVYQSWDIVRKIPKYQAVAGVLLFRKIFQIAPEAKELFNFTDGYGEDGEDDESLYTDPDFLDHAKKVVNMLDIAVDMLGPDLGPVTHALQVLGAKHVGYGVLPEHYPIVGEALLSTLETALGEAWTPIVKDGWTAIYGFVSSTMIAGAKRGDKPQGKVASTSETQSEKLTEPPVGEASYSNTVEAVHKSWDIVKTIPKYQEVAGVLLFRKIFHIEPSAKALFKFTEGYGEDDETLYSDPDFLTHAKRVVNMLDVAVNMLGPDLGPVTHALHVLGAKHVGYGVLPEHYPIVGEALLSTLETALGEAWTTNVKDGWTAIYGFVSSTMIAGANIGDRSPREEVSTHQIQSSKPVADEVPYAYTIEAVHESWEVIRKIPNYQEVAGVLLFGKIFETAPWAKELFKFTYGYGEDDENLYSDPDFLTHARRVVNMLDVAVNMLGPDLGPVTHALHLLGAKHVCYGVLPEHYPIVGEALLSTLETALGNSWTPRIKNGWTAIYGFVSSTMIAGAKYGAKDMAAGHGDSASGPS